MADNPNTDPKNDHPDGYGTQLLMTAVVLIAVGILISIFAKVIIGAIFVLLGMILGGGSRYAGK